MMYIINLQEENTLCKIFTLPLHLYDYLQDETHNLTGQHFKIVLILHCRKHFLVTYTFSLLFYRPEPHKLDPSSLQQEDPSKYLKIVIISLHSVVSSYPSSTFSFMVCSPDPSSTQSFCFGWKFLLNICSKYLEDLKEIIDSSLENTHVPK